MNKRSGRAYVKTLLILLLVGVFHVFRCSSPTRLAVQNVKLVPMADTTVAINNTVILHVHNASDDVKKVWYFWSFNDGRSYLDSTLDTTLAHRFSVSDTGCDTLQVKAVDQGGITLGPVSCTILVRAYRPSISSIREMVVSIGDSLLFQANALDTGGTIVSYVWAIDGNNFSLMTPTGLLPWPWGFYQAGTHIVYVKALAEDSLFSPIDTIRIIVVANAPVVHLLISDTSIFINDTLVLKASANDAGERIAWYVWALDGINFRDSTALGSLGTIWKKADAGVHIIRVKAINGHGVESQADSMLLTVNLGMPYIKPIHDTLVSIHDTVLVKITAYDTNGTITRYFWNIHGAGWDTSSTTNAKKIYYSPADTQKVIVGAMDNDSNVTCDTFSIMYNNPPRQLFVSQPAPNDTVIFRLADSTFAKGQVLFRFNAVDPDGPRDTLRYYIYAGKTPKLLSLIYAGKDTTFTMNNADSTRFYWKIVCKDRYGDSTADSGTFVCLLQKTICFSGHSIITGDDGDGVSGGFRDSVLTALRKHKNSIKSFQPVGPLCTGLMSNRSDDSCFALSGSSAPMMYTMLTQSFPLLNADFWVFMIGVNKSYDASESQGTILILNEIHRRNPQAGIFVLNGLPYLNTYSYPYHEAVLTYNTMLADSVMSYRSQGWRIWVVDAFAQVMQIDSTFNPALTSDGIHPNQAGYNLIGKAIIDTMLAHQF